MPAPVHNPAAQALPHMAHTPDPQPPQHTADTPDPQPPQHTADTPDPQPPPHTADTAAARPRIRDQIAENPLASLLGTLLVVLLGFNLTVTHDRTNRLEDKVDAGFAEVDARFAEVDAEVDARFDSLESGVAEINLKLTALIAHLNATEAVDAALEGRLTGADTANATDQPR